MSSAYERMKAVITELGFTSNEKFEDAVGLGHGFVSRIKDTVMNKSLMKITAKFPQVNILYIKFGIGDMFVDKPIETDEEDINARFWKYLNYKGIKKIDFIKKAGVSQRFPTMPENGTFTATTTYKIHSAFPDINLTWLVYGVGDMLLKEAVDVDALAEKGIDYRSRIVMFCEKAGMTRTRFLLNCRLTKTSIMQLPPNPTKALVKRISAGFPQLNMKWLLYGEGSMLNDNVVVSKANVSFIPLVPQKAHAGYLGGYSDSEYISKLPTIPFIKLSKEKYIAFEVSGDSMNDGSSMAYQNGDIVICKECNTELIKTNGLNTKDKEYIIVHKMGILLKRIEKLDLENGIITLHSFNPIFENFTLELADVLQIWVVEYQQRRKK